VIEGLNHIIDLAVPEFRSEGGTLVIPAYGRISDIADVAYYRDMTTILRDRIQDMVKKGMTLEQVKAARPTADYDGRYGAATGQWTTDMFIEAVYKRCRARRRVAPRRLHPAPRPTWGNENEDSAVHRHRTPGTRALALVAHAADAAVWR
jgi:hypothetical protein